VARRPLGDGLARPGTLLGVGLGGFVDGIVLHQILQWHHMVSHEEPVDTVAGLEVNTVWDGLFHAFTWIAVVAGLAMLWSRVRAGRHPAWGSPALWGWVVFGWGLFNLVEGLVNHHVLGVHHVRDDLGAPLSWDLGFLASGLLLMGAGWWLQGRGRSGLPGA
jgi:uncharacterized membrane protein